MNDFAVYLFYLFVFSPTYKVVEKSYKVREWNRIGKKRFIMTYKDTTPMKQDNLKQVAPFFFQKRVFVKIKGL